MMIVVGLATVQIPRLTNFNHLSLYARTTTRKTLLRKQDEGNSVN